MSKLYYSSSEVSTMLELEPSVLRFWEDQFSQLRIKRNRAGKRMYREKDIELIRTIKQLTRDEGYTIAGAKKKLQESAANRGAQKAARTAERADRGAEQAASGPEKADPGTAQVDTGAVQVDPGEQVAPGEQAAPDAEPAAHGEQKAPPTNTSAQTELIQWLRSNLIEIRNSMD
ncbi:MAG: MerR family transcriptional regulator [Gemmatimonadetes bacterium]|nr:MerR family transcriptional regulator [Gemmatimonadota bacterium]MYH18281.1 MerR family transcriptional regulator [Gemmatimonadota bacterium]MYK99436.1 MerR family transcriptional regulator [Gemmatimonadota bacterium]